AIAQSDPVIDGAELTAHDGFTATWHWCPTREQQAETRYTLALTADDGDNPKTIKEFLVVLQPRDGSSCPGTAPAITHTPHDVSSILDVAIDVTVSDDRGIKDAPLVYVSPTPPATPPDLSQMALATAQPVSGDRKDGVYRATVRNPVAAMPAGTQQRLYYLIIATDDDDTTGSCDHTTTSPVFTMLVTSTGAADLPMCAACTGDAQCGAGDECVRMGTSGATFCLQACAGGCPTGTTCSTSPVASVNGAMAPQCVPDSGTCAMPTTTCTDDSWEVNDSRSDASHNPVLAPDRYDLVSCPSTTGSTRANDDWFKIVVDGDQRVDLQLAGGAQSDLDLRLYHADGTLVTASTSLEPTEEINTCLRGATYYVKVNGYGRGRNPYRLTYDAHAESCATTCQDDTREDDDTFSQARETTFPLYISTGNAICPGDDDWYSVPLFTGEQLTIDLAFTQSNDQQDLDLHLYRDGVDLWPCDVANQGACSPDHGQSGSSNEHAAFTAPAGCDDGCTYFVVVRGYDHSSNQYGIGLEIDE
ncbi:MAG TPA: hypothetical protein VLM79_02885, partial [Kofleriaceae bacterium]|nr:hypothetical protein [Kofleriaceae bacterium]